MSSSPLSSRRLLGPMLLLGLVLAYFSPTLMSGALLAPGDGIGYYYPIRVIAFDSLRHGEWPFWNPFNFGGTPLFAGLQAGVLFPGNWAFLCLPPSLAMNVSVLAATWIAACGAFAFGRSLGMPLAAALVTGTVFAFSGFMAFNMEAITMVQAAGLAPWVLWVIERFRQTGRHRYAWLGVGLVAAMVLAGHPQMAAYGLMTAGAYALWRGASLPAGARWRFYAALAAMVALGVGLALPQLLPTLAFIKESQRAVVPYDRLIRGSLEWRTLPNLMAPFLYGTRALNGWFSVPVWAPPEWLFAQLGYVGVPALMMAGAALAGWRESGAVRFWSGAALVAFLLALGGHTPLYRLWALIPVVNQMQYAHRHLMEWTLIIAVLAGLGMTRLLSRPPDRATWALLIGPIGLALGGLAAAVSLWGMPFAQRAAGLVPPGIDLEAAMRPSNPAIWLPMLLAAGTAGCVVAWQRARWGGLRWAVVALVALDLGSYGALMGRFLGSPQVPASATPPPYPLATSPGRHLAIAAERYPFLEPFDRLEALRYPGPATLAGVMSVNGYDAFISARLGQAFRMDSGGALAADAPVWLAGHHGFDLLALTTLRIDAATADRAEWRQVLNTGRWQPAGREGDALIFRNPRALPFAWRPSRVKRLAPSAIAEHVAGAAAFEPRVEALVEAGPDGALAPGPVSATVESLNRLRLETAGPGAGMVVVSQSFSPGWRAFSGSLELPVRCVDGLILGVDVPAGSHVVTLRYEPPEWGRGWLGAALSAIVLLGWIRWRWRSPRKAWLA